MSEKTNDEKLKILQERLTQIKQKKDTQHAPLGRQDETKGRNPKRNGCMARHERTITLAFISDP